jgi:hypothetical protein
MHRHSAPTNTVCRFMTLVAGSLVSSVAVTPVLAQAAIEEPGYFAQFYPDLDVLKGGAPTPAARLRFDPAAMQAYAERESGVGPSTHYPATPLGRRNRR